MSSRHSAIFVDRNPLRASGIFNNRRGSDVGINKKMGEPILTDFIKKTESPNSTSKKADCSKNAEVKPRREKTESDIVLRQTDARKGLRENLEARRKDIESQFLREADIIRRRSSRPIEVNSVALSIATNSIDGEEYLYLNQVIPCLILLLF